MKNSLRNKSAINNETENKSLSEVIEEANEWFTQWIELFNQ